VTRGGHVTLTANQWLTWHPRPALKPEPLPNEWVLRQLQSADLDDPTQLRILLNVRGMTWSTAERLRNPAVTPEELAPYPRPPRDDLYATVHLSDVHILLSALREAGAQWLRWVGDGTSRPASFDWLLHVGTQQFSYPLVERSERLEGDLFEAACWQLYGITREKAPVKRCQNERCGRIYYRQDHQTRYGQNLATGTKYCSTQCREAQKKRVARRRP